MWFNQTSLVVEQCGDDYECHPLRSESVSMNVGKWVHVMFSVDGTSVHFDVGGGDTTGTVDLTDAVFGGTKEVCPCIGCNPSGAESQALVAELDFVTVATSLNRTRLEFLSNHPIHGIEEDVLAHFDLDEGVGHVAVDSCGRFHGSLLGDIAWSVDSPNGVVTMDVHATPAGLRASPASVEFTSLNWFVPQEVLVTIVDDNIASGFRSGELSHAIESNDWDYDAPPGRYI